MKILKMHVERDKYCDQDILYKCVFDEIPALAYEKIDTKYETAYVGSAVSETGDVIFSHYLREGGKGAYGGRELLLPMKDGSEQKIKDYWWDSGCYPQHGEFVRIAARTLEDLQKCYIYQIHYINKDFLQKLLDDYYSREREYDYDEIKDWVNTYYKWYPVKIGGKVFENLVVNKRGHFADKRTKKRVYVEATKSIYKENDTKCFRIHIFKYMYNDGNRLIRMERKLDEVYRDSLPVTEDELEKILKNA